jgi:hypothetical protein
VVVRKRWRTFRAMAETALGSDVMDLLTPARAAWGSR